MHFVGPRSYTLRPLSIWKSFSRVLSNQIQQLITNQKLTWKVVVVAFKLGSSFIEEREIKKKIALTLASKGFEPSISGRKIPASAGTSY
jgi:hypothetical protein